MGIAFFCYTSGMRRNFLIVTAAATFIALGALGAFFFTAPKYFTGDRAKCFFQGGWSGPQFMGNVGTGMMECRSILLWNQGKRCQTNDECGSGECVPVVDLIPPNAYLIHEYRSCKGKVLFEYREH